jgi:hypothetical protein
VGQAQWRFWSEESASAVLVGRQRVSECSRREVASEGGAPEFIETADPHPAAAALRTPERSAGDHTAARFVAVVRLRHGANWKVPAEYAGHAHVSDQQLLIYATCFREVLDISRVMDGACLCAGLFKFDRAAPRRALVRLVDRSGAERPAGWIRVKTGRGSATLA